MHGLGLGTTLTPTHDKAVRTPPKYLVYVKEKKNKLL
jgi:hypothetical protein